MSDFISYLTQTLPPVYLWIMGGLVVLLLVVLVRGILRPRTRVPGETEPSPTVAEPVEPATPPAPIGLFQRLKSGLSKTRNLLTRDIEALFSGGRKVDAALLDALEELLITSDIGVQTTAELIETLSRKAASLSSADDLKAALRAIILEKLAASAGDPQPVTEKPRVIMVVGVNGVGKTTTIGKLAARLAAENKKVLIAAADTFRAAAAEQLGVWAERSGAELIRHREGSDPAAVAFDGVEAGIARGADVVIVDTAGRLHTKVNLMEELKKVQRTISKKLPGAPHEVLLVLDATTGQNAVSQARQFHESLGVTAIALTKLDGTAKGGIVVAVCDAIQVPLRYIGVGEQVEDLQTFDPEGFVNALFG